MVTALVASVLAIGCRYKVDRERALRMELQSCHAALTVEFDQARKSNPNWTIQDAAGRVEERFGSNFFRSKVIEGAPIRFNPLSILWEEPFRYSNTVAVFVDRQVSVGSSKTNGFPSILPSGDFMYFPNRPF